MRILPASERDHFGHGPFLVARIRPGRILGPNADPAFGPLSVIDRATLTDGAFVRMHEHQYDEILSWIWRGTMLHEDRAGERVAISADRLMLMNAGASFWHEESVGGATVEMLQIFVRPREPDLKGAVQFWDAPKQAGWRVVAGPEGGGAPLIFRQDVTVLDQRVLGGESIHVPNAEGLSPWLYVMDGALRIGDKSLERGDAMTLGDAEIWPEAIAGHDTTLILFLVDRSSLASRRGTISGR